MLLAAWPSLTAVGSSALSSIQTGHVRSQESALAWQPRCKSPCARSAEATTASADWMMNHTHNTQLNLWPENRE